MGQAFHCEENIILKEKAIVVWKKNSIVYIFKKC